MFDLKHPHFVHINVPGDGLNVIDALDVEVALEVPVVVVFVILVVEAVSKDDEVLIVVVGGSVVVVILLLVTGRLGAVLDAELVSDWMDDSVLPLVVVGLLDVVEVLKAVADGSVVAVLLLLVLANDSSDVELYNELVCGVVDASILSNVVEVFLDMIDVLPAVVVGSVVVDALLPVLVCGNVDGVLNIVLVCD